MLQIKKQKLKYYGHIVRHECLEGVMIEGRTEGKRRRRRPCKQGHDDITEWLEVDIRNAKRATENRKYYTVGWGRKVLERIRDRMMMS